MLTKKNSRTVRTSLTILKVCKGVNQLADNNVKVSGRTIWYTVNNDGISYTVAEIYEGCSDSVSYEFYVLINHGKANEVPEEVQKQLLKAIGKSKI